MPGHLALKQLDQLIRKGEVDTVLTVFPDGFGRLMGKRVVGSYFLDHVVDEGAHACIYLFTVDMEMAPLPGFRLTSWERGYGDMKVVPDLATLRIIPWLTKTALVLCDVYTEEGEPIEEAPRWVLKRQVARAAKLGYTVKTPAGRDPRSTSTRRSGTRKTSRCSRRAGTDAKRSSGRRSSATGSPGRWRWRASSRTSTRPA